MAFAKTPADLQMTASEAVRTALEADIAAISETQIAFIDWARKVPEPRGALNFTRFPMQRELYEQGFDDKDLVVMKATQVGISAWLVRWALCWADLRGARVLYVFPRERQLLDFSDTRVRPLILGKYLRDRVPGMSVMNKALKEVGLGIIYFRGSESESGLESIDADAIAFDEHDLLVQAHIPVAERRIGASELGLIRRIGFPTIDDFGIAREYAQSDQRDWFVKCEGCNLRQPIKWYENVDTERVLRVCKECRKPLDMSTGEWVAQFPDRDTRGYHVTKLQVPGIDLGRMVKASQAREEYKRQIFANRDLGEPWTGEGNRLTPALIAACQRQELVQQGGYSGNNAVFMGIDVASARDMNVWISEEISEQTGATLFVDRVSTFDELANLMDRFRVVMAVIDHLPENRLSKALADKFAGRVYLANYAEQKKLLDIVDDERRVSVRRTESIDAVSERIRSQRELLPMDLPEGFVEEMCANVRSVERDDVGRVKVVWHVTGSGHDDFMQAGTYLMLARECWWIRQAVENAEEITSADEILEDAFDRSTLGDQDEDPEYSAGLTDGSYAMDPTDYH